MKKAMMIVLVLLAVVGMTASAEVKVAPLAGAEAYLLGLGGANGFGLSPYFDVTVSPGVVDIELFTVLLTSISPSFDVGTFGVELYAYLPLAVGSATLTPYLSFQDYYGITAASNAMTLEVGSKFASGMFFAKLAFPIGLGSSTTVSTFVEPGITLDGGLIVKARAAMALSPTAELSKLRWYVEKAFDKIALYAYGDIYGFSSTITYDQYIGVYFVF